MRKIILWGFAGFAAGLIFPAASFVADISMAGRSFVSAGIVTLGPAYLIMLLFPAVLAAAGSAVGLFRSRLSDATSELEYLKGQLQNTEQQAEIGKLMEELSVNLDHLVDITNNIHEGICILDRNLKIEYGYNKAFLEIFGSADYIGKSVMDTVFQNLLGDVKKELREYMDLCFVNTSASDDMMNDVNPVARFSFLSADAGSVREKILKTKMVRIKNFSGDVENLMFIFNDITLDQKIDLAFEKKERAFQDEMSIMELIYKNDKDLMVSFINEMNDVLERIQAKYGEIRQNEKNTQLLYDIQGIVHLIKGEAFSLGFEEIAVAAREMEDYIKSVHDHVLTMEINLKIIELYESIFSMVNKVNLIAQKLFSIGAGTRKTASESSAIPVRQLDDLKNALKGLVEKYRGGTLDIKDLHLVQRKADHLDFTDLGLLRKELSLIHEKSAIQYGKRSELNFIYDIDGLPEREYRLLKEVLVHLIRNSIAHGIEDVSVRREKGKDDSGRINIHLFQENSNCTLLYSEDGAGFDLEKIVGRAVELKLIDRKKAENLTDRDVINIVFRSGFSTNVETDMVSGVGIGMSAVKHTVLHGLNGTLKIMNRPNKGISVKLSFPIRPRDGANI